MEVPILKQEAFLIATPQAALSDADLNQLRMGLVQQVDKFWSRAVIELRVSHSVGWRNQGGN